MNKIVWPARPRWLLGAGAVLVCLLAFSAGTLGALISKPDALVNHFRPACVDIAPVENGTKQEDTTNPTVFASGADKKLQILNKGPQNGVEDAVAAYIRVALVPVWRPVGGPYNATGKGVGAAQLNAAASTLSYDSIVLHLAPGWAEHWKYGADGYFYCKDIIEPDASTSLLLASVEYDGCPGQYLTLQVLADGIQTQAATEAGHWAQNCL